VPHDAVALLALLALPAVVGRLQAESAVRALKEVMPLLWGHVLDVRHVLGEAGAFGRPVEEQGSADATLHRVLDIARVGHRANGHFELEVGGPDG